MIHGRRSRARRSSGAKKSISSGWRPLGTIDRLLVAYGLLVLWNSLIPFELHIEAAEAVGVTRLLGLPVCGLTYPDAMSNIVAYVPLGALLALRVWLGTRSLLLGTLLAVGVSGGLSWVVEYAQQYTTVRISSVGDVVCNVAGAGVGSLCAPLVFSLVGEWGKRWARELRANPLASLTKVYAGILVIIALVPWSFTVDLSLVGDRYRSARAPKAALAGALVPEPAYADCQAYGQAAERRREAMETVMTVIYELLSFAVLAALVSRMLESGLGFRWGPRILLTIWLVGGLATLVAVLQLFVRFGTGGFAAYLGRLYGCLVGMVVYRWVPAEWTRWDVLGRWRGAGFAVSPRVCWPLIPGALFIVLFMGWVPFFFSMSEDGALAVNAPVLLPFYKYFQAKAPIAYQDFFIKLIRFGALGFVLSLACGPGTGYRRWRRLVVVGFWCAAAAALVEVVQVFIPTRHPDLTDVLLGAMGGALGVGLHSRLVGYLGLLSGVGRACPGRRGEGQEVPLGLCLPG